MRTAQRWEAELNLPVRRPRRKGRSPVMALRSEIDLWLKATMQGKQDGNGSGRFDALMAESRELRLASQRLRGEVRRSYGEFVITVDALVASMRRIALPQGIENGVIAGDMINYPLPRAARQAATARVN